MQTNRIHSEADGSIRALRVVGIHGRFSDNQTPARAAPVLADSRGHHVIIREASPAELGFELAIDVARRKLDDEVWSRTGTRVEPPWQAQLGNIVAVLGQRESSRVQALLRVSSTPDEAHEVTDVLRWMVTDAPRSETLRCVRVEGLVLWYCTPEQARDLWKRIATVATRDMFDAATRNDHATLKRASYWLSRAATSDTEMYLAVAGLRKAQYPHWKALLDAGIRGGSEASRLANVEAAEHQFAPAGARSTVPSSPRASFGRNAVLRSMMMIPTGTNREAQVVHG